MSEENKNLINESGESSAPENNNSKKKKAIIIGAVIVAVAVIIAVVACVSSGSKENEGTTANEGVSEIIEITPNGEGGNASGSDNANQSGGGAGGSSSQSGGSQGGSSSQSGGSSSQGGSQNGNSQNGAGSSNEQETPGETTTIPKNRIIYINVLMPENKRTTDKIEFIVNGKSIGSTDVTVDGEMQHFKTPDEYEGDVSVEVKLLNYGTSATGTVAEGSDTVEIRLPLNRAEENLGDDF